MRSCLYIKYLIIWLLFLSISTYSQISVSASVGYNPKDVVPEEVPPDGTAASWYYGYSFGISAGYYFSPDFLLSASVNRSDYKFDRYLSNMWATLPEVYFISASGKDSRITRVSVEAKYFPFTYNNFRLFIFSGLGFVLEDIGEVKETYFNDLTNKETTYINNPPVEEHLAHSLGLGIKATVFSDIYLELSGFYYSNYWGWWQPTLNLSLGYDFY